MTFFHNFLLPNDMLLIETSERFRKVKQSNLDMNQKANPVQ